MKNLNMSAPNSKGKGLRDKDLQNLYSLSDIKKLQPDIPLFRQETEAPSVYLFLDGELKVSRNVSGETREVTRLQQDNGGEGVAFIADAPWTVTVTATRPSTVLTLKRAVFDKLDKKIQLFFYKRRYRFDDDFIDRFMESKSRIDRQKELFQSYMLSLHTSPREDYLKSEIIAGILDKIPRLPTFTSNIAASLMDEEISSKAVADLVKEDPSLAAGVLKTENSPYYGFGKNISDINHAVILLGFNELYQLVIAEGINRTMPNSPDFKDIFKHSICISRIAFALSLGSRVGKPAEISTIGLLHDLGTSVKHLLKKQNPKIGILIDYIDAAVIGAVLMEQWNLPERVCQSIELQNYPRFTSPDNIPDSLRDNVAVLYLAHVCFDFLESPKGAGDSPFIEDYIKLLGTESGSPRHITKKFIMPVLKKNLSTFPAFFRKLITKHTRNYEILN